MEQSGGKLFADRRRKPLQQLVRVFGLLVDREPQSQTELGIVFKQRVRPGRPATLVVRGVRRSRQVAAVDRRASSRVRNHGAVAEQLRHRLDVRRLAATRAGAAELEQGLEQLQVLYLTR